MKQKLQFRNKPDANALQTRKMAVASPGPSTVNEDKRSVEAVMASDAPVRTWDWDLGMVDEVLLMSGAEYPEQVPLLDTHSRYSAADVLGSVRDIRPEGSQLLGTVYFSSTTDADDVFTKVREGHLTDFSVGYLVTKSRFVEDGMTEEIDGQEFTGPVKVALRWEVRELSICPIGADQQAKARSKATTHTKESIMDPKLREFLESRGLVKDASEEQAWAFLQTLETKAEKQAGQGRRSDDNPPASVPAKHDGENVDAERTRAAEIMALGQRHDCMDLATEALRSGQDLAGFQAAVLEHVSKQDDTSNPGFRAEMGETDKEKFRSAVQDSLMFRSGIGGEQNDLASYSLRELARECLTRSGSRASGGNVMQMVGRAMTASDFPIILANTANRSLAEGYEAADETWAEWCATGSVSDFKTHTMARAGETDDLEEVPENGEYKYGSRSEAQEQYAIATYGKKFAISRQAVINDDLGALTDIPFQHGEAAARKVGDVAYVVLTGNAAMGDGVALFHADHGNLAESAGLPVIATLGSAVAAMKVQKDIGGKRRLNIRPRFFLAPVALEVSTEQILKSSLEGTQAKPNLINPYTGNYFTRVYEPRLDDDSAKAWYLAGPKGKTIKVFFLNGNQKPYMETRNGWDIDGVEYKVRMDCGAKAVDWRAVYKNAGA